ncbi:MAG: glycosyltransferase family 39 protein, partial [bacterium]
MKNKIWNKLNELMVNKKNSNKLILIILLLFLLVRVPILFTGIHQMFESEELVRGSIAREIIQGPKFNLIDYQGDSYSGGTLIAGIITIPFFLLLGENLLALKLVALMISTLILFLLFKFCDRFFDRKIALVSCFLFIFCPPLWTIYSFLNFGFFHESILLTLMALFIFYAIFFENKKQNKYFLALVIICGFSFYFVYLTIFSTTAIIITWFLFDKKFFLKKSFLVFIAGALIGLSPWIYYQLLNNWAGISILFMGKGFRSGQGIGIEMLLGIIKKFFETILIKFPESLYFKDTILNYFYYYILFFSSVVLLYYQNIKALIKNQLKNPSKELFILVYFVVFLVLFSLSNLVIRNPFIWWRYLTPLYPFAFIATALAINKINFSQYKKMFLFGFVFFVLIFWLIGNNHFYEAQETNALNEKGFSYTILGRYWDLKMRLGENPEKMIENAKTIDSKYRLFVFYNMKQGLIIKTAKLNKEQSDEENIN